MNSLKLLLKTSLITVALLIGGNAFSATCYDPEYGGYYECADDEFYSEPNPYYFRPIGSYYYPSTFYLNIGPTQFRHFHSGHHHFHHGGFHQFHGGKGIHFHGGGFHGGRHHH